MEASRFDLVRLEEFNYKGHRRSRTWKVGKAMQTRKGFMIFIPEGLAVSGRILMVPEQSPLSEIDLIESL
ncbi:MAG: hypothetical protein KDJ29_21285 [Hyphomicrobiales bacterium]|nr:hypothetical protein [Hyphomicrobiales bacterium]